MLPHTLKQRARIILEKNLSPKTYPFTVAVQIEAKKLPVILLSLILRFFFDCIFVNFESSRFRRKKTEKKITKVYIIFRDELRAIISWTKLPVTDAELDDFIQYLDHSGGGYLEYKDIARTRTRFLSEERKVSGGRGSCEKIGKG